MGNGFHDGKGSIFLAGVESVPGSGAPTFSLKDQGLVTPRNIVGASFYQFSPFIKKNGSITELGQCL
jgi:hypothetical protein